jgi:flagellin
MSDVTLSKAVRSNLLHLQNTAKMMDQTQERLATGLRVNSALDNPTNFFTASALKSRAKDLDLLMDAISNGVQTLQAADKGISSITKLVEAAQATARQALQTTPTTSVTTPATITGNVNFSNDAAATGTGATLGGGADASTITASGQAFTIQVGGQTHTFQLFDSANGDPNPTNAGNNVFGVDIDFANDDIDTFLAAIENTVQGAGIGLDSFDIAIVGGIVTFDVVDADVSQVVFGGAVGTALGVTGSHQATSTAVQALTGNINVAVNGNTTTVSLDGLNSAADLAAAFDAVPGVRSQIDVNGFLTISASSNAVSLTLTNGTGTLTDLGANMTSGATITATTTVEVNPKRRELVDQYNELLIQISDMTRDASFNGVNLINGDNLEVLFNEDGSSRLVIQGVTFDAASLGLTEIDPNGFDVNADIEATLDSLKAAVNSLRTQASRFGANLTVVEARQNFTKQMINTLESGAANLTLADTNEEAANMLALQTR